MSEQEFPYRPYSSWRKNIRLHIDIDATTLNRPPEYMEGIIRSIEANKPFIIYHDQEHFLLSITQYRIVMCFVGGIVQTKEILQPDQHLNRIKIAMTVYDKFSTLEDWYRNFPAIDNVYLLSK